MEPHEYVTMFEFEAAYWWYRGLHTVLIDTTAALKLPDGARVLDAGCGTGQNLVNMRDRIAKQAYGFDFSHEAACFWPKRGLDRVCVASINDIPFQSNQFDVVMSVDVFECEAVLQEKAYRELLRVLKPQGYLILVVPAYEWLMSEEHHRAVQASRRYSRAGLEALLRTGPVKIQRITHLFASSLPALAAYRIALRYLPSRGDRGPKSELQPLHPIINSLLLKVMEAERHVLRRINLPFGSSILAVAKKLGE